MRYIIFIIVIGVLFFSCNKNKYTTAPQITYKSISANIVHANLLTTGQLQAPMLNVYVTDLQGDLGFINGVDTSRIYIKNLFTNISDSFFLPDLQSVAQKKFQADISVNIFSLLRGSTRTGNRTDTMYFEVYVKDFAKNKSNVIKTGDPVYFITP